MIQGLLNQMKLRAAMTHGASVSVRIGTISGYDPNTYTARVLLQPENIVIGPLPITSPWIGNQWGLFAPPSEGDAVEIQFQEGDVEAGFICNRFYSKTDLNDTVPSGEFWLVHAKGTAIKIHNDGSLEIITNQNLNATIGGQANLTVTGKVVASAQEVDITATAVNITGQLSVSGNILSAADIIDNTLFNSKTMAQMRGVYDSHTHSGVQTGSGTTSTPTPQI
jgi:hypothetical protein